MSDVPGMYELIALQCMADPEVNGYGDKEAGRLEALLRNRVELIEALEGLTCLIECSSEAAEFDLSSEKSAIAKAKELT